MSLTTTRALLALLAADPPPAALAKATDPAVVALAARLGVLPVIAGIAVRGDVLPDESEAVGFALAGRRESLSPTAALLAARFENRARQRDLAQLERRAMDVLGEYRTVPLKGAGLRRHSIWPDPDDRPQRDVDLWCPEVSVASAAAYRLRRDGFRVATDHDPLQRWTDDHHDDPLVIPGVRGAVEIHRHPTIERARSAAAYDLRQTRAGMELTATSLVLHIIVHAQLQDFAFALGHLPLIALLDTAHALEGGFVRAEELLAAVASREAERAVRFHLACVARLRGALPVDPIGRRRWSWAEVAMTTPRIATLQRELAAAPYALSREMMRRRIGASADRPVALLAHRIGLVVSRGARTVKRVASRP